MNIAEIMRKFVNIVDESATVDPKKFGDLNNPDNLAKYQQALDTESESDSGSESKPVTATTDTKDVEVAGVTTTPSVKPQGAVPSLSATKKTIVPGGTTV